MLICREPELVEKVFGCLAPADMELIDRGKIVGKYDARPLAKRSEPISNCIGETAMRVVPRDTRLCWHRFASLRSVAKRLTSSPASTKAAHDRRHPVPEWCGRRVPILEELHNEILFRAEGN
jgi:hypothetical protein